MSPKNSTTRPAPDLTDEATVREFFAPEAGTEVPPYAHLRRRVVRARGDGTLPAGTRLPPVRTLAGWLDLAPNTVAKAYKELEAAGVVETRGRAGSFVRGVDAVEGRAVALTEKYLKELRTLGVDPKDAESLVRRVGEDS